MPIKNPLLEKYAPPKGSSLLGSSSLLSGSQSPTGQSSLLGSSSRLSGQSSLLVSTSRSAGQSSLLGSTSLFGSSGNSSLLGTSAVKRPVESSSFLSVKHVKPSVLTNSSSLLGSKLSSLRPLTSSTTGGSFFTSPKSSLELCSPSTAAPKDVAPLQLEDLEISAEDPSDCFLSEGDCIPLDARSNVINNYFDKVGKATVVLSPEEILKQDFINLTATSLIRVPDLGSRHDDVRCDMIKLVDEIAKFDPEFILKTALFTRKVLNIRVTANFLVALAAFTKPCRRYIKKYYAATVALPSDWIDIAELYTSLGDRQIGYSAIPVVLRKAMAKKFPTFDVYQIGKYNKAPKKKGGDAAQDDDDDDGEKLYERHFFTLKQLIRKIHVCEPPDIVMPVLGKKYPATQDDFYRSRLNGIWDESRAGKRMKIPTPYTWETQLASKGNNAATWKELVLSRKLPYMAMLRNLRNIIQSGVKENIHKIVQKKLCSPIDVKRSKQFPFRFLSAYAVLDALKNQDMSKNIQWSTTPDFERSDLLEGYKECLDKAVQLAAINNVKPIKGSLLILFNCGDAMDEQCSTKGFGLVRTIRQVAGLMTLMMMFSSEHCKVLFYNCYGSVEGKHIGTGGEILKFLETFVEESNKANKNSSDEMGGMKKSDFFQHYEKQFDVIIDISDSVIDNNEEMRLYRGRVNEDALYVTINLKSREKSASISTTEHRNDIRLSGFSDQILQYISERGSGNLLSSVESIDKKFSLQPLPKPMAQNYVSPLAHQVRAKVWRVFVSSTFLDLKWEREKLMHTVIPEINKWAGESHNVILQEVDLRWGVTEEEGRSNKVILRCLTELSKCHIVVAVIGNRYGRTFDSYPESPNPDFAWLSTAVKGYSITELEIRQAVRYLEKKPDHVPMMGMVVLKESSLPELGPNSNLIDMLENIKEMNDQMPIFINDYDKDNFAETAEKAISVPMELEFGSSATEDKDEDAIHFNHLDKTSLLFVGRQNLVTNVVQAIKNSNFVMVTGHVGTGKSALTAKALSVFKEEERTNDFYHFVALTPDSKDLNNLLMRLCFHLSKIINEQLEDGFDPINTFWAQISKCETPFKILIDGCDELLPTPELYSWLPDKFPANVKVIFTCNSPGPWATFLNKKYSGITSLNIGKLSATEKSSVAKEILRNYGKKLEDKGFNSQMAMLLSKKESNNPRFIEMCISHLRHNAFFETLSDHIKQLPQTIEELYIEVLRKAQNMSAADRVMQLLYCSKNGMYEADLLGFSGLKPMALATLLQSVELFIELDMRSGILSLRNQLARNIVLRHCFGNTKITEVHSELAEKYRSIICGEQDQYTSGRAVAFQCTIYHLIQACEWKRLATLLTNLNFVRQMVYLGLLPDLVSVMSIKEGNLKGVDKAAYKSFMLLESTKRLSHFLINNKTILNQEPFLLQQRLISHFPVELLSHDVTFNDKIGYFTAIPEHNTSSDSKELQHRCIMNEHSKSVVTCVATCPGQTNLILVGFQDSKLQTMDMENSRVLLTYRGHTGPITCCGFLTSSRFVSGGSDGSLRLWGILDTVCIATIEPHTYQVLGLAVNTITKCVLSAGLDRRVAVWHNDVIFETVEFENPMNCITFIDNGKKFVAGSWTGEVYAAMAAGKDHFVALDISGNLSLWDQKTLDMVKKVRVPSVTAVSYDQADNLLLGLNNGFVQVAAGFGKLSILCNLVDSAVTSICQVNDKTLVLGMYRGDVLSVTSAGSAAGRLALWNSEGTFISATKPSERGSVNAVLFDKHGESDVNVKAFVGTDESGVMILEHTKLDILASLNHHKGGVRGVQGMMGDTIVSISSDNTIQAWQWKSNKNKTHLKAIQDIVWEQDRGSDTSYTVGIMDTTGTVVNLTVDSEKGWSVTSVVEPEEYIGGKAKGMILERDRGVTKFKLSVSSDGSFVSCSSGYNFTYNGKMGVIESEKSFGNGKHSFKMPKYSTLTTFMGVTSEGIFLCAFRSNMTSGFNLKTGAVIPPVKSHHDAGSDYTLFMDYPTASTFFNGNIIVGTSYGYIKIPGKKHRQLFERVFNSAVSTIDCVTGSNGRVVLFAGSKEGVVKVLSPSPSLDALEVIGMFHTGGEVTCLRVLWGEKLRPTPTYTVVVGDKSGVYHVLTWKPPRHVE
eukprot:sb/3460543/